MIRVNVLRNERIIHKGKDGSMRIVDFGGICRLLDEIKDQNLHNLAERTAKCQLE